MEIDNSRVWNSVTDLYEVKVRLKTFDGWKSNVVKPADLAKAGFYWLRYLDAVKCVFCGQELAAWEEGDSPLEEHRKYHIDCVSVKNRRHTDVDFFNGTGHNYVHFDRVIDRVRSFNVRWELIDGPGSLQMAAAGFVWSGRSDWVTCFSCGLNLSNWTQNDDPFKIHEMYKKPTGCKYLDIDLKEDTPQEKEEQEKEEKFDPDELYCKVCLVKRVSMIFMPCNHLVTCEKCSFLLKKCPCCRGVISKNEKVYF